MGLIALAVVAGIFCALIPVVRTGLRSAETRRKRIQLRMDRIGADRYFGAGSLIAGLDGATGKSVICAPGSDFLVFMRDPASGGRPGDPEIPADELGRIPRDAVDFLAVRDLTQTQKHVQTVQRLSITRMAVLGPLSLAAPKRKKITSTTEIPKFYLTIDWTDPNGIGQETIFEFVQGDQANLAEAETRRHLKPKAHSKPGEKKCPKCAEMIKAEATKCRYCSSDLPAVSVGPIAATDPDWTPLSVDGGLEGRRDGPPNGFVDKTKAVQAQIMETREADLATLKDSGVRRPQRELNRQHLRKVLSEPLGLKPGQTKWQKKQEVVGTRQQEQAELPPPQWALDPTGENDLRYWDGHRWTDHVSTAAHPRPVLPDNPSAT